MRSQTGVDLHLFRGSHLVGEHDRPAAANAVAKRAQAVRRCRAVAGETAALTAGGGFTALVQRAAKVPSRCSSAFEVFCAAGSDAASVAPGATA